MSIQADIMTALSGVLVVNGKANVFPNWAAEDIVPPVVIIRRTVYDPIMLLTGPEGTAKSTFIFECWGDKTASAGAKGRALAAASAVKAALAAATTMTMYQEPVDGEQFDPDVLEVMEPLAYSFWHVDS